MAIFTGSGAAHCSVLPQKMKIELVYVFSSLGLGFLIRAMIETNRLSHDTIKLDHSTELKLKFQLCLFSSSSHMSV